MISRPWASSAWARANTADTNIPMYAHGAEHSYRRPCQAALRRIVDENLPAFISTEVVQEIMHHYLSLQRPQQAIQVAQDTMTIVSGVLPVTKADINRALGLIAKYPTLQARDLLHLAVMLENDVFYILSTDAHFDQVGEIERLDPRDFAYPPSPSFERLETQGKISRAARSKKK